jgi:hypothetical protein
MVRSFAAIALAPPAVVLAGVLVAATIPMIRRYGSQTSQSMRATGVRGARPTKVEQSPQRRR